MGLAASFGRTVVIREREAVLCCPATPGFHTHGELDYHPHLMKKLTSIDKLGRWDGKMSSVPLFAPDLLLFKGPVKEIQVGQKNLPTCLCTCVLFKIGHSGCAKRASLGQAGIMPAFYGSLACQQCTQCLRAHFKSGCVHAHTHMHTKSDWIVLYASH